MSARRVRLPNGVVLRFVRREDASERLALAVEREGAGPLWRRAFRAWQTIALDGLTEDRVARLEQIAAEVTP